MRWLIPLFLVAVMSPAFAGPADRDAVKAGTVARVPPHEIVVFTSPLGLTWYFGSHGMFSDGKVDEGSVVEGSLGIGWAFNHHSRFEFRPQVEYVRPLASSAPSSLRIEATALVWSRRDRVFAVGGGLRLGVTRFSLAGASTWARSGFLVAASRIRLSSRVTLRIELAAGLDEGFRGGRPYSVQDATHFARLTFGLAYAL